MGEGRYLVSHVVGPDFLQGTRFGLFHRKGQPRGGGLGGTESCRGAYHFPFPVITPVS